MKKLSCLLVMLSLVAFSSCKKDKRIIDPLRLNSEVSACGVKDPVNNLQWLKEIVQEAKKDGSDKYLTITKADYNGNTYFDSWLGYSSCWKCSIFDCGGNRVEKKNFTQQQWGELTQALDGKEAEIVWGRRD